ncbi:MAG: sugar transferase [Candidatus Paceibacterota bacterium]
MYKQKRVGKDSEHFLIWKLQSMKQNAEKNGAVWAEEKDSRITRFGKILRKLHIDEIPQMINVLKGDINLVGPRPERPEFVEKLEKEIPYYFLRHSITPGFTGWAQIKYRYARTVDDSQDKFEYDLYYLKNRNVFLDFGIIIKTIQIIFTH